MANSVMEVTDSAIFNVSHPPIPDMQRNDLVYFIVASFYIVFCIFTVLGNITNICAFLIDRSLRDKPRDLLVVNLSFADLGIGLFCMPFVVSNLICDCWPTGEVGCRIFVTTADIFLISGASSLIAISLDRYLLVARDYTAYLRIQTYSRIKVTIVLCWIYALIPTIVENAAWTYGKGHSMFVPVESRCFSPARELFSFTIFIILVGSFIPLVIISSLSFSFLLLLRKRLSKQRKVSTASANVSQAQRETTLDNETSRSTSRQIVAKSHRTSQSTYRYTKPAITFVFLIGAVAVTTLPYVLYMLVSFFCPSCHNQVMRSRLINLAFINSVLNPFMYAATQTKIRKFYALRLRHLRRLFLNRNYEIDDVCGALCLLNAAIFVHR